MKKLFLFTAVTFVFTLFIQCNTEEDELVDYISSENIRYNRTSEDSISHDSIFPGKNDPPKDKDPFIKDIKPD